MHRSSESKALVATQRLEIGRPRCVFMTELKGLDPAGVRSGGPAESIDRRSRVVPYALGVDRTIEGYSLGKWRSRYPGPRSVLHERF